MQQIDQNEFALLIPEGMLRLRGTGRNIVALVDGQRSISQIVDALTAEYGRDAEEKICNEVVAFLNQLKDRSVLIFHSEAGTD
jgi:coenzyme PQQ biosynthesis protein PqqD